MKLSNKEKAEQGKRLHGSWSVRGGVCDRRSSQYGQGEPSRVPACQSQSRACSFPERPTSSKKGVGPKHQQETVYKEREGHEEPMKQRARAREGGGRKGSVTVPTETSVQSLFFLQFTIKQQCQACRHRRGCQGSQQPAGTHQAWGTHTGGEMLPSTDEHAKAQH